MTGEGLEAAARAYLGVPWRHMGRTERGLDCIGLVIRAAQDCGIEVEDTGRYRREPEKRRLIEALDRYGTRVARPERGDVLVFRMGLYAAHVGIMSEHPQYRVPACIHAYYVRERVVEEVLDADLKDALICGFRVREG